MSYHSIPLRAGQAHRVDIAGRLILVDSVGDSGGVDIEILSAESSKTITMPKRKAGFRLVQPFAGVVLTCVTDATIGIFLSDNDVNLGTVDGAAVTIPDGVVITNTPAAPVPVTFDNDINIGVVQVENNLNVIVDAAPVAVGITATTISNDPTLKKLRLRNVSNLAHIAIGGANVELGSPIVLAPGELFIEDDAAGAHLYAVATGEFAFLQIQGLKK